MPHCDRCGKLISKEEFETYGGLCEDCYETEIAEEDMEEDG